MHEKNEVCKTRHNKSKTNKKSFGVLTQTMPPVVTVLQCRDASASLQIICQTDEQYTITICGLHNIWSTETQIDQTGKLLIIFDVAPAKSEIANKNPVCQLGNI